MRLFFILLISCLYALPTWAWTELTGNIRGIVTNSESGSIIRGATITLIPYGNSGKNKYEGQRKCYSQDAGEYIFAEVPPGLYNLECSAFGFQTLRLVGVQVKEDRTKLAYFKMIRGSAAVITETFTYAALEAKRAEQISTGSSTKESINDAPATVYVITKEDIELRGYMALSEVLQDIPEIELQHNADPEKLNIMSVRGIKGNEKMLLLINGRRANSMASSTFAIDFNYNIRYAERIEIILGPASALYGSDAYTGVINIITHKEHKNVSAGLTGSYGMFNTTSNAFHLGLGGKDVSFSLMGGFYYSDQSDFSQYYTRNNDVRWLNDPYRTNGELINSPFAEGTSVFPIKPFDRHRFAYFVDAHLNIKRFQLGIFHNREEHSSATSAKPAFSPYWSEARFGTYTTGINASHLFKPKNNKKWSLESIFNITAFSIDGKSNFINALVNYNQGFKVGYDIGGRWQETFRYTFNKNHKITAGFNFQNTFALPKTADLPNQVNARTPFNLVDPATEDIYYFGTDYTDDDGNSLKIAQNFYYINRQMLGGFFEYRFSFREKLLITLGVRYDHVWDNNVYKERPDVSSYASLNPRLGVVYKPSDNWTLKLFYGEGFLQPSPQRKFDHFGSFAPQYDNDDEVIGLSGGFWRLPNENLNDEKVRTGEISLSFAQGDLTLGLNSYVNILSDVIRYSLFFDNPEFEGVSLDAAEIPQNSSEIEYTFGGTFRADYQLIGGSKEQFKLNLNASYSYCNGQLGDLAILPFAAEHTAKAGILVRFHNFSLYNSLLFRSATRNEGYVDNDGIFNQYGNDAFFLWNAFAKYRILKEKTKLDVFVKVNNVLDQRYYNTTNNSVIGFGASPQEPFTLTAGISVGFGN